MRLIIEPDYDKLSTWVADYVIERIHKAAPTAEKPFVLGLPTGSSPIGMYRELVKACKEGCISFRHVITFNMDEYVGLATEHPESYHSFMHRHLFDHIDILPQNIHILNGNAPDLTAECDAYERAIEAAGGIDLFIGGIGPDGHIAFNEPGSPFTSETHIADLTDQTISDNARFFEGDKSQVPTQAITQGLASIMRAKKILLIATGANKADAVYGMIKGAKSEECPASILQDHADVTVILDKDAASKIQ